MRTRLRYGRVTAFCGAAITSLVTLLGGLGGVPTGSEPRLVDGPGLARLASEEVEAPGPSGVPTTTAASATPGSELPARIRTMLAPPLPEGSGEGRRVVFDQSSQRVWLVGGDGGVRRSYLVSGSIYDNLDPGTYAVYSRSLTATGVDGSDLRYMVRFAHGPNAAIGFHAIPRLNGERMQTRAELGTPQSHGCVRQALPDAKALWRFTPVGTAVVVTA